jgi:rubrerythrin
LGHLNVTRIAEDEAGGAIKHAQALGHIVERNPRQKTVSTLLREGKQGANPHAGEREQYAQERTRRQARHGAQRTNDFVNAEKDKSGDPGGKAGGARTDDEPPLTDGLSQNVAVKHGEHVRIVRSRLPTQQLF